MPTPCRHTHLLWTKTLHTIHTLKQHICNQVCFWQREWTNIKFDSDLCKKMSTQFVTILSEVIKPIVFKQKFVHFSEESFAFQRWQCLDMSVGLRLHGKHPIIKTEINTVRQYSFDTTVFSRNDYYANNQVFKSQIWASSKSHVL